MSWYKSYRLVEDDDGLSLEIYLDPSTPEFSSEFLTEDEEESLGFEEQIRKLVEERFSQIKLNSIKLIIGSVVVGALSLLPGGTAFAATTTAAAAVAVKKLNTTGTVTATKLNMRYGPSTDYPIMHILWQGNVVKVIGESYGWYQIRLTDGREGWVSGQYLRLNYQASTREQRVDAVIASAKSFLGTPYVYGGASPSDGGLDCSGFTQYVFAKYGYTLNRVSTDQARNGTYIPRPYLEPGDLIFYSFEGNGVISHVGIYLGNGKMIHSPKTGDVVKITDITTDYWRSRYVTGRRIIQ